MAAWLSSDSAPKAEAPLSLRWTQQLLLFSLFFAGLMLLHAPLLRLPYFWDEAGYYVPAARDLYLTGTLIPHSTLSNAHPPLVMAWLAIAWRVGGYSTLVTRTAMLALAAFSLLGVWRLSRVAANPAVAWATTALTALYPVFFIQSSLAQVDLAAAGLTYWGLAAYFDDCRWRQAVWFSLAVLAKETAILAPLALFAWQVLAHVGRPRWQEFFPNVERCTRTLHLLVPVVPVACWYAYHYAKTGFLLGNPEYFRYNVASTLDPLRIPLALGLRIWQLFGYLGLYLLTLAGLLAMLRPAQMEKGISRPRIAIWIQTGFLSVTLAYLGFMSAVGGAVLARYLLPVLPLVMLVLTATLWRRVRFWKPVVVAVAIAFVAGLFTNPPYGFSLEDNLAYRDYIVMHTEASRFLAMRYPRARVVSAWPASDELTRPWLGYAGRPFQVVRIEDFSAAQISAASVAAGQFDTAFVFSTKYQPPHPFLENWNWWQHVKERFFGYHRDLPPEEIAQRLGGRIVFQKASDGQWVAVIVMEREEEARSLP
ncbi:MAG: glycosyltransferase family 39 protein [Acidobacteriia bacterium]|nr:glycosyltransferase family 39 protein [Terriglobia bacterium]